jgi:uncharacterized protein with PIN domain
MNQATFIFYGELNDFLTDTKKGKPLQCTFNSDQSVKHLIESAGVPHTEVGRILANGVPVDGSYLAEDGDQITVYPLAETGCSPLRAGEARFVLDNHLGRLAGYLRMLGFDALYRNDYQDDELADVAERQDRLLLTRDRRLLMRNQVRRGYWVRSKIPRQQVREVVRRFALAGQVTPFLRCIRCNGLLQPVSKDEVLDRLQPLTRLYFDEFRICADCSQVYWKGSHYERMAKFIERLPEGGSEY